MKKRGVFVLFLLLVSIITFSQEIRWKIDVHSFFDNKEFANSPLDNSGTMAGTHLTPQIGLELNKRHRIFAGVDVMHEFGSNKAIDYHHPILYYEHDGKPFRFYMGSFPRTPLLNNYPRIFFQDSINNYQPTMSGFFWELYNKKDYFNLWLDWTGRQTDTRREAFFMGWSGKYNLGIFYGQHLGYMYHFAGNADDIPESVQDNGLLLTSLGIDFAEKTGFEKLEANAGWSVGLEQDRETNDGFQKHQGFLSEIKVEYKGLGLLNTFYTGNKLQTSYEKYGKSLYWGDTNYRSKQYNRFDGYIHFLKTSAVDVKFTYSLHFSKGNMYHEQLLHAIFRINNLPKKKTQKSYNYIWSNWFSSMKN